MVLYIVGMIFEILMPCYYGSKIKEKSEQLPTQMFSANWPEQSKEFKSCMLIFGERAIRPISPFAGGILALSLPTFVSVRQNQTFQKYFNLSTFFLFVDNEVCLLPISSFEGNGK